MPEQKIGTARLVLDVDIVYEDTEGESPPSPELVAKLAAKYLSDMLDRDAERGIEDDLRGKVRAPGYVYLLRAGNSKLSPVYKVAKVTKPKGATKKAGKKGAKKGAKKTPKPRASTKASKLDRPPRAVNPPGVGNTRVTFESVGGDATVRKVKQRAGDTGWRYTDKWVSDDMVWIRSPEPKGETWEVMSLDGSTLERLEVEEARELGLKIPPRLQAAAVARPPAPPPKKKGLMARIFG